MKKFVDKTVVAKKNYCVPATLQMVLEHYNISGFDQDDIADQLVMVIDDDNHANWGAQIGKNTINDFFQQNGINLTENFVHINQFMDEFFFGDKISELLDKNITVVCGFNYTWLYKNCEDTYKHVSIIVDCNLQHNTVTLLDPGPDGAGYKDVSMEKLFFAIKAAHDGLWCIIPTT